MRLRFSAGGLPARIRPHGSPAPPSKRAMRSSPGVLSTSIDPEKFFSLFSARSPPVPHLRSPLGGPPCSVRSSERANG
jgi:hypothetical protein